MPPCFDVAGLGLNATDHIIRVPSFPGPGGKVRYSSEERHAGGQVAVALTVCRRFGFSVSYAGSVGDDDAAQFQITEFRREGFDISQLRRVRGSSSQRGYIFVDETSGERTIVYDRPKALTFPVSAVDPEWIASGRILHLDGHDAAAAARAAEIARNHGVTVVADLSNLYDVAAIERLLVNVDYLLGSQQFPSRLTGKSDMRAALEQIWEQYKISVVGATLGRQGVLALDEDGYHYIRGFEVETVDTTGAGDVFHGGLLVGLLRGWPLDDTLEFACALAALNCTAPGARGHIGSHAEVEELQRTSRRNVHAAYAALASRSTSLAGGRQRATR